MNSKIAIPDEVILNKIFLIRGQKVMIDRDLSELYGIETKVLKQAVRRNIERFPDDFMFEMTVNEFHDWRSQFVTSKSDMMGLRYSPYCFTEQGVTMLSCVLNSKKAVEINIRIIRVFIKMREMLIENLSLRMEIETIKKKLESQDKSIDLVFSYLDELMEKHENPPQRQLIGFKINKEEQ